MSIFAGVRLGNTTVVAINSPTSQIVTFSRVAKSDCSAGRRPERASERSSAPTNTRDNMPVMSATSSAMVSRGSTCTRLSHILCNCSRSGLRNSMSVASPSTQAGS